MSTKHTPATPLPWRAEGSRVRDALGNAGGTRDSVLALCMTINQHADAAYIAHAANAYPELVAKAAALLQAIDATYSPSRTLTAAEVDMRTLLREIGEDA